LIHSTLAKHQLPDLTALTLKEPDGIAFTKKEEWTKTLFGSQHVAVVSDADFRRVMRKLPPIQTEQYYGYLVPEWSNRAVPATDSPEVRLGTKLDKMNKDRLREGKADGVVVSRAGNFVNLKQATRIMIFVGLFIAAIFSVFTASFLYFKLFNDLQQDQRHYHSLSKIGLSEKEMKKERNHPNRPPLLHPLDLCGTSDAGGALGTRIAVLFPDQHDHGRICGDRGVSDPLHHLLCDG